jgi:PPP family 3-phenylpropionic acid transporter
MQNRNHAILLTKGYYFIFFAAASALLPFLALYYQQLGLSGRQIGLLTSIPFWITIFSALLWGGLADATQQHKRLLSLAIIGAAGTAVLISWAASFFLLIPIIAVWALFTGPIMPLVDNTALEILGDQSHQYGKIRLWGALGWGISAPVMGELVERLGLDWIFYGYALLMLMSWLVVGQLPIASSSIGGGFGQGLRTLLRDRRWGLFLLLIFAGSLGEATVHSFWFLYLKALGATSFLMGFSLTVAMLSEMVIFFLSDRLLHRFGPRNLLMLSIAIRVGQLLAYSWITNPYLALTFQLLHGPGFAAMWVAAVAYVNEITPKGLSATGQGLLNSVSFGFALAIGAILGGFLYEQVGAFGMYRWMAGLMLAGLLTFVLAPQAVIRPAPKQDAAVY